MGCKQPRVGHGGAVESGAERKGNGRIFARIRREEWPRQAAHGGGDATSEAPKITDKAPLRKADCDKDG